MKIGIIGAGSIGLAFASHAAKAGYEVVISNSRGPESLKDVVEGLGSGVSAGTGQDAAAAEIVFLGLKWLAVEQALSQVSLEGKIVIDATNPYMPDFSPAPLNGKASSEIVAELAKGASVVKAFNTLPTAVLAADPVQNGGKRVIFYSGNDAASKKVVAGVIAKIGFAGIDLGSLGEGGKLQALPGGVLAFQNLVQLG
jgi:8-hydroxy-5-deazaflavin:NADPH oxidoreductase